MQIAAAVTECKGAPFVIKQLELGELRADEVRVRVAACGICHTDLIIRDQAVKEATGGVGADFSIDTTGSPAVLQQAVYCTGPGGVCGLIGAPPFGTEVSLDINQVLAMGRTVRGMSRVRASRTCSCRGRSSYGARVASRWSGS